MRAVSTGCGVMFVADECARKPKKFGRFSYKDLIDETIDQLVVEAPKPLTALERLERFEKKVKRLTKVA